MESNKSNIIRLSVVDDHPIIFLGIQMSLRKIKSHSIQFINQYTSGNDVLAGIENLNSDVLLIDMCLPEIKGYNLAKKILEIYPEIKIGIYSSRLDYEDIINSFKNGVFGYLSKTAKPSEIVDFILTISRGERYVMGVVADIICENALAVEKKKQLNITKRESEIMKYVFDGYKNREIAVKLSIAERTVEFHKQNIYIKLDVTNSVDLYKAALQLNLFSEKLFLSN
jgi:DNA-binding NarL/FixJ family response regulator